MTSSSRRKHRTTAPITRGATAPKRSGRAKGSPPAKAAAAPTSKFYHGEFGYRQGTSDIPWVILMAVAMIAALIGVVARAATGQESSRRVTSESDVVRSANNEVFAERKATDPTQAFVLRSVTTSGDVQPSGSTSVISQNDSKRFVTPTQTPIAQTPAADSGTTLQWRNRTPQHFRVLSSQQANSSSPAIPASGGKVAPASFNEPVKDVAGDTTNRNSGLRVAEAFVDRGVKQTRVQQAQVQQAQNSIFTQPEEELPLDSQPTDATDPPPFDLPDLTPPTDPVDPITPPDDADTPPTLDDLLPPDDTDPTPLPDPDGGLGDPMPGALPGGAERDDDDDDEDEDKKKKKPPCAETYRDTDCCEHDRNCAKSWNQLQGNPLRSMGMSLFDLTPRYKPDLDFEKKKPGEEAKARREGLAMNAERTWKNSKGKPLGVLDGEIVGLDGTDWESEWEEAADAADAAGRRRPERPKMLTGKMVSRIGGSSVVIETDDEEEVTLSTNDLSLDDKYWLNGRPWRGRHGEQLAYGRMVDYQWGHVVVEQTGGGTTRVAVDRLGPDELCYVTAYWGDGVGLPDYCRIEGQYKVRNFTLLSYHWKASALCHKPLYFEDVQLERYGHSHGPLLQPIVSTAHFFGNIAVLPYQMGIHPPNECMYALGYYRPGSCAPYMVPPIPLSLRGAAYQTGAIAAGVAIFP